MESSSAYIPTDRRQAMVQGLELPTYMSGAVLFADISGFTPVTENLLRLLGPRRGADELIRWLNRVYDALINEVHRYGGSVITFSGDAITCWFDDDPLLLPEARQSASLRAVACSLAMQQAMQQFVSIRLSTGATISLGMKVAVVSGPVRRFLVGDPRIQYIDSLSGSTLDRMSAAERQARKGEVIVGSELVRQLADQLEVVEFRESRDGQHSFAVVAGLKAQVEPISWPIFSIVQPNAGLSEAQIRPWLLPPVYERLKNGQGQYLAEIRPGVALFMRFWGIDYDRDETAGEKLNFYICWVQQVLRRYDSYLLQLTIGDKGSYLYTAFGAPVAHEDDPARAVAAAFELQHPPAEIDFIGQVQIGISQGRMRAGAYGGLTRRTYGVLGDEVNVAARLMDHAEPGQIILSRRIASAVAEQYRLEYIGQIRVKGKQEPFPVSLVLGRRSLTAQKPVTPFPYPLIGREGDLAQMEQLLITTANSGQGQVLRLEGVAGVGKSHLLAEFSTRALRWGWRVVLGACQSTGQDIPYHPWRQIFRALFVLLESQVAGRVEDPAALVDFQIEQVELIVTLMNPEWFIRLPLLGDLLDLPIPDNATTAAFEPRLRQEALLALAVALVQNWAKEQPLLILLEDAHWLDEASTELALALARVVSQKPVVLLISHRPALDENQPILPELNRLPNYHALNLAELLPEGVAALVADRLKGTPSPLLVDLIELQAKGNPFFVEELVNALREAGHLEYQTDGLWQLSETIVEALREARCLIKNESGQWSLDPNVPLSAADLGLPDSIHGLVLARLDRLLETHKLTLKVASVIGRVFEFQLLAKAHPLETDETVLLDQLNEIEAREFTRVEKPIPHLTHIFKHNIIRDVAYETLLETQQRELHRVVAEAIEMLLPDAVEQLAYHYSRTRVQTKTLFYLDKAARKAQREYANETALNYYRQALALEERWEWRKGQIEILHILGRREEEQTSLARLEADSTASVFEVAYLWAQYYEAIGAYPQAQAAVEQALTTCRAQGDRLNEMRCLAQFGAIARKQGHFDQALDWYTQALTLFQAGGVPSDQEARVMETTLNGLGVIFREKGEFSQARRYLELALTLSRQTGNRQGEARIFNDLGAVASYQHHFAEALSYHRQALEIRQAIGDRAGEGASSHNLAMTALHAGDYGQAQTHLAAALTIMQATGNRWEEINIWNDLGIIYQELGELSQAQSCLEQGRQIAQEIGDEVGQAYILDNLGLVAIDRGDLPAAEALFREGLILAQTHNDKRLASNFINHLGLVALAVGQPEQAVEQGQIALAMRQEMNMVLATADDLATIAAAYLAADEPEQAQSYIRQALAILDQCGGTGPEFPQRGYFVGYQVLARAGHTGEAQAALQAAYNLVLSRANKITDPALRQSFLERVPMNRAIVAEARRLEDN
jgi:class 3 adenylate cyclase/tetratricopeptide (TPR) repeat protein